MMGPIGNVLNPASFLTSLFHRNELAIAGSKLGISPNFHSNFPPYFLGMFSTSTNFSSSARVFLSDKIVILDTVMGSNHRLA